MKVTLLRTSMDFGLHLKAMTTKEFCMLFGAVVPVSSSNIIKSSEGFIKVDAIRLKLRDDYDAFLRKKPTLAMMYNCINRPRQSEFTGKNGVYYKQYTEHKKEWDAAEKEVIFHPKSITHGYPSGTVHTIDLVLGDGEYIVRFYDNGNMYVEVNGRQRTVVNTIEDLARITNSELRIKNVNL